MKAVIINATRQGYTPEQINHTLTVGELIWQLQEFDEDTPVFIGNDRIKDGWYSFGAITVNDVEPYPED